MSLLNQQKAKEIINLCLTDESPEHKSRVLEILALSEIEPNDPLFLVLLSTGNIRVFFEQAVQELKQAISKISGIKREFEATQEKANLELLEELTSCNQEFIVLLKEAHQEAGIERSLEEMKAIREDMKAISSQNRSERAEHTKVMKSLIDGLAKTTLELNQARSALENEVGKRHNSKSRSILQKIMTDL